MYRDCQGPPEDISIIRKTFLSSVSVLCSALQLCPTLRLQALYPTRLLCPWDYPAKWLAISFSRGTSRPKNQTHISCISCFIRQILYQLCHLESLSSRTACLIDIFLFFFPFYNIMCLFLAVLGLHWCMDFSLVAVSGGYSLVMVAGLLIAVASLIVERGLWGVWSQ